MGSKKIKGITIEIGGNVQPLKNALKDVDSTSKKLNTELAAVNRQLKFDPNSTVLLQQKQKILAESIVNTREKLDVLREAQEKAKKQFEEGKLGEDKYRALQREVIATEQKLKGLENQAVNSKIRLNDVADTAEAAGEKMQTAGKKLSAVSAVIAAVGAAAIKAGSDFNDSFAKVTTIANGAEVPMNQLKEAVLELSDETGIAANDIAEDVYNAISAGQKTGDAVNFVRESTKLAKAGFTESSAALDILTTALNAYGLEAKETGRVSDLLIQTQNLGKTTVGQLASSMGKIIPTAKANNVQIDQLCAGYAILTARGIATAESTTYMNSMLNELGKGGTKVDQILRAQTGQSFAQLSAQGKSLGDVLGILKNHADKNNESFGDLWSSSEAGKAGMVLLGDSASDFNNKLKEMNQSVGATDSAFAKMDTDSNKAKIALNQVKNAGIELGTTALNALRPALEQLANIIKSVTGWFKGLTQGQQETILKIAAVVAAIGPALIIIGKISTGISTVIQIVTKIGPAIKIAKTAVAGFNAVLMANPITLIVGAIAALVAGFVLLYNKCEGFRNAVNSVWEGIKKALNVVIDFFKNNWKSLLLLIVNPFAGAFKLLYDNCSGFREFIDNFIKKIKDFFVNGWDNIVSFFTVTIPAAIQNVIQWFEELPRNIGLMIGKIAGSIVQLGVKIGTWIKVDLPRIIAEIIQWFKDLPENIKNLIVAFWNKALAWLAKTYENIVQWVKNLKNTVVQWVAKTITDVVEWFKKLPGRIWEWLTNTIDKVIEWGRKMAEKAKAAAVDLVTKVVDTVKSLPGKMLEIGKNIVEGIWNGIKNMGNWIKDKIKEFAGGIVDGFKGALGIHSPSTAMASAVGQHIPTGILSGAKQAMPRTLSGIKDQVAGIIRTARERLRELESSGVSTSGLILRQNTQMAYMGAYGGAGTNVNVNISNCKFKDRNDIDYLTNRLTGGAVKNR